MTDRRDLPAISTPAAGEAEAAGDAAEASFYVVCSARYFPALVGLVNSLRMTGHAGRIVVGDCGLTDAQRARLRPFCTLFEIPREFTGDPVLLKAFARARDPEGVAVIIDADMIVTGSLEPMVRLAAEGRICAFADPQADRWFAEWEALLGLRGTPRKQTYLSSGFVAFAPSRWPQLLERWWAVCQAVPHGRTLAHGAPNDDSLALGDQDALNALLMTEFPWDAVAVLPAWERPVWEGAKTRLIDLRRLSCTQQGRPIRLLHADGNRKPWEFEGRWRVEYTPYVRLLRRLLFGLDVPLRARPSDVVFWMRPGRPARTMLRALTLSNSVKSAALKNRLLGALGNWAIHQVRARRGPGSFLG